MSEEKKLLLDVILEDREPCECAFPDACRCGADRYNAAVREMRDKYEVALDAAEERERAKDARIAEMEKRLFRYEDAVKYPGNDQRHRGASVAVQLVHAQIMREKAEAERDDALARVAELERSAVPRSVFAAVESELRDAKNSHLEALASAEEAQDALVASVRLIEETPVTEELLVSQIVELQAELSDRKKHDPDIHCVLAKETGGRRRVAIRRLREAKYWKDS